jgi:hypothetical protein
MPSSRLCHIVLVLAVAAGTRAAAQIPGQPEAAAQLRAHAAALRSDLRNLVVSEESFFADHLHYSASLDSLRFVPSRGVNIAISDASGTGWSATARYSETPVTCRIFVGSAPKPRPTASEGAPECEGVPGGQAVPADSVREMIDAMQPMFGNVMATMYEGLLNTLARPETANKLAAFTRNYYEALVRHGFTAEQALRIVSTVGIPMMR